MLGARWGAAVPFRWRRALHGRRTAPNRSWPHSGSGPSGPARPFRRTARWERLGRPSMLDHYRDTFPAEPLVVELGGVRFGNAAGLRLALDRGAVAVVSLCRMGADDVPDGVEHHVIGMLDTTEDENPNLVLVLADTTAGIAALTERSRVRALRRRGEPHSHCRRCLAVPAPRHGAPRMRSTWLPAHSTSPSRSSGGQSRCCGEEDAPRAPATSPHAATPADEGWRRHRSSLGVRMRDQGQSAPGAAPISTGVTSPRESVSSPFRSLTRRPGRRLPAGIELVRACWASLRHAQRTVPRGSPRSRRARQRVPIRDQ